MTGMHRVERSAVFQEPVFTGGSVRMLFLPGPGAR